jgi:hypothetical protein
MTAEGRQQVLEREGGLVVEHRGDLHVDGALLNWYTAQPDPAHWVAVGSVTHEHAQAATRVHVGVGRTETAATADLLRLAAADAGLLDHQANVDHDWVVEWSL